MTAGGRCCFGFRGIFGGCGELEFCPVTDRKQKACGEREQADDHAPDNHETQVGIEDTCSGNRAGRRRHHRVCRIQPEAQRNGTAGGRHARSKRQRAVDRR